jgi:hypothetical protein
VLWQIDLFLNGWRLNMSTGMNFFTWIRDGVRQSVLLGVSDAIETLGAPASTEDLHPSVAGLLKVDKSQDSTPRLPQDSGQRPATSNNSGGNRKRLGRSLKDIESESK